jgi:hypothetical protein
MSDYIMTVESDVEDANIVGENALQGELNPEFVFDISADPYSMILDSSSAPQDAFQSRTNSVCLMFHLYWMKI